MAALGKTSFPPGYAQEDIGGRVIIVAAVFIVLEVTVVALRLATRITHKIQFGADDWLIVPALFFSLGMCAIAIVEIKIAGVGRHLDVLLANDPVAVTNWAKCGYVIEQLYCVGVAFPKLSILASYLRILVRKPYRIAAYLIGAIITVTAVAGVVTSLASCRPFAARWNLQLFVSNCMNAVGYWKGMSVPNIVTDVVMLILPLPVIWDLQIGKRQKVALAFVFLLGSLGMVSSIARLTVAFRMTGLQDGTWDSADLATWSLAETGCYLIAACLPTLRPLYLNLARSVKSRTWLPCSRCRSADELELSLADQAMGQCQLLRA